MKRLITGARAALSSRVSRSTLHTFTCTLLLAAAACRAFGGGVYSETTFYRDVSEGVWAAPSGFQISHYTNTAAGTYTNGATTIYYRLSASVSTNERTPISSVLTAAWYGTNTASNVVVLAWDKSDAAVSYVVERSYDNATWTNWYAVTGGFSAPTNASDVGGLATGWTNTDWSATTAEVAAPTFPWGGGGSAGLSSVLAIDNNANALAITNVSDIVTTGDATFGENDAGSDISIRAENNIYGGSIRVFGETAGGHITMRTDDNNGTVQIEIRDGTVYDFDEGFLNMGSASITNLSNIYSGAAGTTNAVTSSGIVDIGPTLALALLTDGTRSMTADLQIGTNKVQDVTGIHFVPTNSAVSSVEGNVYWDETDITLALRSDIADAIMQVGQEFWMRAKKDAGETISNGDAVYISGASGERPKVARADSVTNSHVVGLATHTWTSNDGWVTMEGLVRDLDTSSYSEGDELFVSATSGGLTNVSQFVGQGSVAIVTRSHPSAGHVFVSIVHSELEPAWNAVSNTVTANALLGSTALQNVVEDTTPELGGSLNAAANSITNVSSLGFADGSSLYSTWLGSTCTVHFVSPSATYTAELILIAE